MANEKRVPEIRDKVRVLVPGEIPKPTGRVYDKGTENPSLLVISLDHDFVGIGRYNRLETFLLCYADEVEVID